MNTLRTALQPFTDFLAALRPVPRAPITEKLEATERVRRAARANTKPHADASMERLNTELKKLLGTTENE